MFVYKLLRLQDWLRVKKQAWHGDAADVKNGFVALHKLDALSQVAKEMGDGPYVMVKIRKIALGKRLREDTKLFGGLTHGDVAQVYDVVLTKGVLKMPDNVEVIESPPSSEAGTPPSVDTDGEGDDELPRAVSNVPSTVAELLSSSRSPLPEAVEMHEDPPLVKPVVHDDPPLVVPALPSNVVGQSMSSNSGSNVGAGLSANGSVSLTSSLTFFFVGMMMTLFYSIELSYETRVNGFGLGGVCLCAWLLGGMLQLTHCPSKTIARTLVAVSFVSLWIARWGLSVFLIVSAVAVLVGVSVPKIYLMSLDMLAMMFQRHRQNA